MDDVIVDTGSEMTWIPRDILDRAGVEVAKASRRLVMANGIEVTRDVGYAVVRCEQFETVDEVVFAERDDLSLLGARTLEGFNAVIGPRHRKLVAAGPIIAAPARR